MSLPLIASGRRASGRGRKGSGLLFPLILQHHVHCPHCLLESFLVLLVGPVLLLPLLLVGERVWER
jgi:hypothetical protein